MNGEDIVVRNLPEEVAQTLRDRAAAEGKSLSSYLVDELTLIANRPQNAEIVAWLQRRDRSDGPSASDIVEVLRELRR